MPSYSLKLYNAEDMSRKERIVDMEAGVVKERET